MYSKYALERIFAARQSLNAAVDVHSTISVAGSKTLLIHLFKYKAWANDELLVALEKLEPAAHQSERHTAIRIFNHIYVVDQIFAAHLSGRTHSYTDEVSWQGRTLPL